VPDSFGRQEAKPRKVKFQIQQELGAKPETSKGPKGSTYTPGLTEWLVRTLPLVSAEEYSDGVRLQVAFGYDETALVYLWQIVKET
jgi:hypothetical protein